MLKVAIEDHFYSMGHFFCSCLKTVYNWAWKANICVEIDIYIIYLKK